MNSTKGVITVVGLDQPGIIAAISNILADAKINIDDISQSFAHDFFTMILIVDFKDSNLTIPDLREKLDLVGEEMNLKINVHHSEIFKTMHRI